jgi:large subunit ribosomal protein L4
MEFQKLLPELEFGNITKPKIGLIHRAYLTQLNNSRKYCASTKTKSEVRGGGRKPWKQKGTGNARAGSSRSPLWEGGGVSFGPKPHLVSKKINKKEKGLAMFFALYLKQKQFIKTDESVLMNFENYKTKTLVKFLENLGITKEEKVLILLTKPNKNFWLASRNLKNIEVGLVNSLNIYQLLKTNKIVFSDSTFNIINLTYAKRTKTIK